MSVAQSTSPKSIVLKWNLSPNRIETHRETEEIERLRVTEERNRRRGETERDRRRESG